MEDKKDKNAYLKAKAMVDPATNWIEIHYVPKASADLVAKQVGLALLTRYPLPTK